MGFNMLEIINEIKQEIQNEDLNMRIGVHTVR
jgi:hypothetical protein